MAEGGQERALSAGSSRPLLTQGTMTEKRAFFGETCTRACVSTKQTRPTEPDFGGGGGVKSSER